MFRPKLIVTDLDGSALRNDKTLSQNTIAAFAKCSQNGIPIAIATARYITGAKPFAKALHADFQILIDGTLICQNDSIIYSNTMSLETTNAILRELYAHEYTSHIAIPTAYGLFRYPNGEKSEHALTLPVNSTNRTPVSQQAATTGYHFDISKPFPYPANKMVVELPAEEAAVNIAKKCGCSQFRYRGEDRYTFFHPSASKLSAIQFLTQKLGITLADVLVFGDDTNDIEMITHCGYGIAMGNALDTVKSVADEVTATNEEDGIAKILQRYFQPFH